MPLLISKTSIEQRIAEAGEAAMPQATLDAADFGTIRPDEPADFAANYPAVPARRSEPPDQDDDPVCVCGVHKSEHALCGCPDGFERRR